MQSQCETKQNTNANLQTHRQQSQITEEHKRLWIAEKSWAKSTKLEGILTIKIYYRATVTNIVWCHRNNRHGDLQNRTEAPQRSPHICSQLSLDKSSKNIHWRKKWRFDKRAWENCISSWRRLKPDLCRSQCTNEPQMDQRYKFKPWNSEMAKRNLGDIGAGCDILDTGNKRKEIMSNITLNKEISSPKSQETVWTLEGHIFWLCLIMLICRICKELKLLY